MESYFLPIDLWKIVIQQCNLKTRFRLQKCSKLLHTHLAIESMLGFESLKLNFDILLKPENSNLIKTLKRMGWHSSMLSKTYEKLRHIVIIQVNSVGHEIPLPPAPCKDIIKVLSASKTILSGEFHCGLHKKSFIKYINSCKLKMLKLVALSYDHGDTHKYNMP